MYLNFYEPEAVSDLEIENFPKTGGTFPTPLPKSSWKAWLWEFTFNISSCWCCCLLCFQSLIMILTFDSLLRGFRYGLISFIERGFLFHNDFTLRSFCEKIFSSYFESSPLIWTFFKVAKSWRSWIEDSSYVLFFDDFVLLKRSVTKSALTLFFSIWKYEK